MAMAARIAMMATTIISSMRVKPCCFFMVYPLGVFDFTCPVCRPSGPLGSRATLHVLGRIRRLHAKGDMPDVVARGRCQRSRFSGGSPRHGCHWRHKVTRTDRAAGGDRPDELVG